MAVKRLCKEYRSFSGGMQFRASGPAAGKAAVKIDQSVCADAATPDLLLNLPEPVAGARFEAEWP